MSWIANDPEQYEGEVVGSGQCVAFVQDAANAPLTREWTRGRKVKGANPTRGTAIATFDADGTYGNHTDGTSHAAIFLEEQAAGLLVWDQWSGHPVAQRVIRFKNGAGDPVNDGDQFYVIEQA